jgi:SAM-dependent methyltransferase
VITDAVRWFDRKVLGGALRRWWNKWMILGGGWGEFLAVLDTMRAGNVVVDLGAGEAELRQRVPAGVQYLALDRGIGHAGWDYSRLDAVCDANAVPLLDDSVDLVVSKQVLEHLQEPIKALSEMRRVLKVGGRVVLSTNQQWPQHQQPHDYFRYTSFGLQYCFSQAGLEIERMTPMGGVFTTALFHASQTLAPHLWTRSPLGRQILGLILSPVRVLLRLATPVAALLDRKDAAKDNTLGYYVTAKKLA